MEPEVTGGNSDTTPPLTFESAYAADTSPVSDTTSTDSTTTPAAAEPGAVPGLPQTTDDRSPYIPRERFDQVNAKYKAAEERAQKLAWAESIDQARYAEQQQWYQRAQQDPVAFVQSVIEELQAHPEHGAKLRSIAARALSQGRGQTPVPAQTASPLPVIQLEDGTAVDLNALRTQWLEEARAEFAPAVQTAAELKQERQQLQAQAQAETFATDFLAEVRKLPDFTTHEAKIKADLAGLIQSGTVGDHPAELRDAVRSLYIKHSLPAREATAQSRHLDDLQRKAAASTGINPGSAAATSPRRPTSFSDPALKW